jgi:hypothetical protein
MALRYLQEQRDRFIFSEQTLNIKLYLDMLDIYSLPPSELLIS